MRKTFNRILHTIIALLLLFHVNILRNAGGKK